MSGRFIAVVGASGVGKDSFMTALAAQHPAICLARRVVTRPQSAGGEDFDSVSAEQFAALESQQAFALSWSAHGLHYGVRNTVDDDLAAGRDVVANLSRAVLRDMQSRFTPNATILLTADRKALAQRLRTRARETEKEIARRLERADFAVPSDISVIHIDNSGPLADTVAQALAVLYPAT
ncbi:MAG: phosphonate metabolism protein/1,5-bisphosphokinase (PRPP-forming) PhnN [Pikeienuella sp.]